MTRMSRAPRTDTGAGLLPIIVRVQTRLMLLWSLLEKEFPLTLEQATTELTDTDKLATTLDSRLGAALSGTAFTAIETWRNAIHTATEAFVTSSATDPEQVTLWPIEIKTLIKNLATETFALTATLDLELFGLEDNTDAGRLP